MGPTSKGRRRREGPKRRGKKGGKRREVEWEGVDIARPDL